MTAHSSLTIFVRKIERRPQHWQSSEDVHGICLLTLRAIDALSIS